MSESLKSLLKRARSAQMSSEEKEEQRRSFAYGNSKIENERITRETVDQEADRLAAENGSGKQI